MPLKLKLVGFLKLIHFQKKKKRRKKKERKKFGKDFVFDDKIFINAFFVGSHRLRNYPKLDLQIRLASNVTKMCL